MITALLEKIGLKRSFENPAVPLSGATIAQYLDGGVTTPSGKTVTVADALRYSPIWGGVDMISSDVSRLPLSVYERSNGKREKARRHPAYRLLRRHTGEVTSNIWLARMVSQALLYGNGYSRILRSRGEIAQLQWLHADRVQVKKEAGKIYYLVKFRGKEEGKEDTKRVEQEGMFHLVGLTLNELGGLSLIDFARNTIGRQQAAEHFGDDFFANLAQPSGFFEHPAQMSDTARKQFIEGVKAAHAGAGKRFKAAVLEEGMKWVATDVNPDDALLIDQLKWGVKDVARFLNIPPHRLGDDAKSSFASLEQENLSYIQTSLGKWISRIECEATEKLFSLQEKSEESHYAEFEINALGRADMATRHNSYALAIQWGWMNRNEVRERENLNPYDGGDEYLTPLNMTTEVDQLVEEQPAQEEPPEEEPTRQAADANLEGQMLFAVRMIVNAAARKADRGATGFWTWLQTARTDYQERFGKLINPAVVASGWSEISGQHATEELLKACEDAFLSAAECQPDELPVRIRETLADLTEVCQKIARNLTDESTCQTQ